ncbi:MAG: hypothetical protein P8K78_05635 [Pirellulales bacterium]|nr:hypothetical protein [Pirellulales bacterium]
MKLRRMHTLTFALILAVAAGGCGRHHVNNLPPSQMLMEPGPGVGGPGPGVMLGNLPTPVPFNISQVAFSGPAGMHVIHDTTGQGLFASDPLIVPARENFPQGAIYRLKLTDVPGRPGDEYYPTLEVGPTTARTEAYLAHNAVPVEFTSQDFDQVKGGNFVTKVIYLPDPEYQQLALAAIETLVSTRLDPGVDPIQEADRRGSILAIVRLGNKILEGPGMMGPGMMGPGFNPNCPVGGNSVIQQVQFQEPVAGAVEMIGGPQGFPVPERNFPIAQGGLGMTPPHLAGVTAPQYGMPITGTPIGLPGPPHVPLGVPAGLQSHSIKNWTRVHMPEPTKRVHINVEQKPGYSYPQPANRVRIVEQASKDHKHAFRQPWRDRYQWIGNMCPW